MRERQKIAILGGGMASLTAAFWLSQEANWQEKYEITIYQMGWRLGGKLWNGRHPEIAQRDDEHGYHILFGFYRNVFEMMRLCYAELGRSADAPISRFFAEDPADEARYPQRYAMKRNQVMYMAQAFAEGYKTLKIQFPANQLKPDDWSSEDTIEQNITAWLAFFLPNSQKPFLAYPLKLILQECLAFISQMQTKQAPTPSWMKAFIPAIRAYLQQLWRESKDSLGTDWSVYLRWVLSDMVGTALIGLIEDDVLGKGLDSLNHLNFYEWLLKHQTVKAGSQITLSSTALEFAYTMLFAFQGGDVMSPPTADKPFFGSPNIETGTALRFLARLMLDYQGTATWIFQVNAGDAIVAPLYQVLQKRGVNFKFFHKVKDLHLSADKTTIAGIRMERQVELNGRDYQPLITVKGVPTWSGAPLYEQIQPEQAEALRQGHVNLESHWTDWRGTELDLQAGRDFDKVILGIPVAALKGLTGELAEVNPAWQAMLSKIETVRSFGIQTWMTADLPNLGWDDEPVLSNTGVRPVTLRADCSQVLDWENWSEAYQPKNRSYFGGFLPDDPNEPEAPAPDYPVSQEALVKAMALDFLRDGAEVYWPQSQKDGDFLWEHLIDMSEEKGVARFDSQFYTASIDPTMRYVQAAVGTSKYRLAAQESGFANLILTGDWLRTGLNCGCLESTIMSGKQAAKAINGKSILVWGEEGFKIKAKDSKAGFWFISIFLALMAFVIWRGRK